MNLGGKHSASHWSYWALAVVSAWGCSDKGASHAAATPTSGTTTVSSAMTAANTASTSGSSASHTASGGAPTTSTTVGSASGGSSASNGASDGGGLGGEAGADAAGGTTSGFTETVEGDHCSFALSHAASTAIGTVQIVTWSTDLPDVAEAHIDFGLTGSELAMTAPVDLAEPDYRTLLLGMKGARSYSFRLVASSEAETCTSAEISFTTGPVPEWVPAFTKGGEGSNASQGFIVTTSGILSSVADRGVPSVYIFDTDGDVVWWAAHDRGLDLSSARMSWDGRTMYYVTASAGVLTSVSMDGLVVRDYPELVRPNHDLVALPGGGIATLIVGTTSPGSSPAIHSFVEMKADGTIVPIVPNLVTLFGEALHPNAAQYQQEDDTFTLSNRQSSSIAKFTRTGELLWQIGGDASLGNSFDLVDLEAWDINHGHHLTQDDRLLIFNNSFSDGDDYPRSRVFEVLLDEDTWTATKTWEYSQLDTMSGFLGDVQRLPNGNVLITYSTTGKIIEVTPSGEIVQSFDNEAVSEDAGRTVFGYATFRTSLYGPPPR